MSFYRHYKNKNYRYLGVARHSESLEELALYEALYPNDLGRIWVRPLAMFHEDIEWNGKRRPRFEKQNLEVQELVNPSLDDLERIVPVAQEVLSHFELSKAIERLQKQSGVLLHWIEDQGQIVAFKLGYRFSDHEFYSWIGGVLPSHRKLGLGRLLMRAQHKACKDRGYISVFTKTQNRFPGMLMLNLSEGFLISGTEGEDPQSLKIVLHKSLE